MRVDANCKLKNREEGTDGVIIVQLKSQFDTSVLVRLLTHKV